MNAFARFEDWLDTFGEPHPQPTRLSPTAQTFVLPLSISGAPSDDPPSAAGWHLFEHAFAWVPEADKVPQRAPDSPSPPPRLPTIGLEAILKELNLDPNSTVDQLQTVRRRFMWDNHPDRRPDLPPDTANRRVAIANMLIDRALKKVGKRSVSLRP